MNVEEALQRIRALEAELAMRREYMEAVDEPAFVKMRKERNALKTRVAELERRLAAYAAAAWLDPEDRR